MGTIFVKDREGNSHKLQAEGGSTIMEIIRDAGLDIMPVYHQGEDYSVMKEYVKTANYIGLGGNRFDNKRIYFN